MSSAAPNIRMLALDVDGTLAAQGDAVSSPTREALRRAQQQGIEVVIATGRRYRTTRRVVESLDLAVPVVCLGGALVVLSGEQRLLASTFEAGDFREIAGLVRDSNLAAVGQLDSHERGGADFVVDESVGWNPWLARYVEDNEAFAERTDSFASQPRSDVLVVGTFGERAALERVAVQLHASLPGRFCTHTVPSHGGTAFYLEITPAHVSKWSGLSYLARHLDIGASEICAVGDEVNDLPMIEASRLGVAMRNGHERVKAAADWVCGRHDEDGLVGVVDRLLSDR